MKDEDARFVIKDLAKRVKQMQKDIEELQKKAGIVKGLPSTLAYCTPPKFYREVWDN